MAAERVTLADDGSILISAALRKQMGWEIGEFLTVSADKYGIRVRSQRKAMQEIQDEVKKYARPGVSVVDELIRERREEVSREDEEFEQWKAARERRKAGKDDVT